MFRIKRILNNNAVIAVDNNENTLVALGNGIAFQRKVGQIISKDKIEKSFYPKDDATTNQISNTLSQIDPWYIELSDKIISETTASSGKKLSDDIYVSLPDHLQFAVERIKNGIPIQNRLTIETMQTYPDEFEIGKNAVKYLGQKKKLEFPEDEATNIAMHLITAEEGDSLENTENSIEFINHIVNIIEEMLDKKIDSKSVSYYRLITHLKFFVQRINNKKPNLEKMDDELFNLIIHKYHNEYLIAQRIAGIVLSNYNYEVSNDDIMFLTIHIHRVSINQKG